MHPSIFPDTLPDDMLGINDSEAVMKAFTDPHFWEALCPDLNINRLDPQDLVPHQFTDMDKNRFIIEGYFKKDAILAGHPLITKLKKAVEFLYEKKMLPLWITVFDEFWELARILDPIVKETLGEDYKIMPDIWVWYLEKHELAHGWGPHRDRVVNVIRSDGSPMCITLWVALSEATPENGCMYVLPASQDPYYPECPFLKIDDWQSLRALPAPEGSVMGWNHAVLHWGARSSKWAVEPRMSIAFEFQRSEIAPFSEPLLDPLERPSFETRLQLVGKQMLQYNHMYKLSPLYEKVSQELIALTDAKVTL